MNWIIDKTANYLFGRLWYTKSNKYHIQQHLDCVSLEYKWGNSLEDIQSLASRPNWNMNAVKELKEIAYQHYKEQGVIEFLLKVARSSTCCKNKVGAVIVNDNYEVISFGNNGAPKMLEDEDALYKTTLHAEEKALLKLAGLPTIPQHLTLYTTLSPCISCASKILFTGIKQVKYLFPYTETYGIKYLNENGILCEQVNHNLKLKPFNLESYDS